MKIQKKQDATVFQAKTEGNFKIKKRDSHMFTSLKHLDELKSIIQK